MTLKPLSLLGCVESNEREGEKNCSSLANNDPQMVVMRSSCNCGVNKIILEDPQCDASAAEGVSAGCGWGGVGRGGLGGIHSGPRCMLKPLGEASHKRAVGWLSMALKWQPCPCIV